MKPKILLSVQKKKENYINAIQQAGGIAVAEFLPVFSDDYDGLVLSGGGDVNPKYYGDEISGSTNINDERDEAELAVIKAFVQDKKPILGICRGHQVLNVAFGGTLYQDIINANEHASGDDYDLVHEVVAYKGSVAQRLYSDSFMVNSYHHQGIKKLGDRLKITMMSGDVVEGVEHETLPVIGVQWHPERMCVNNKREDTVDGIEIFKYFIDLCKNNRGN